MEATAVGPKIVGPTDATEGFLGSIGARFMIDGAEADQRFSCFESLREVSLDMPFTDDTLAAGH